MKFLRLLFVLPLFLSQTASAQVGCRIGNYILTDPTGGTHMNGNVPSPIYAYSPGSANTIYIRNWDQDPNCGILRNVSNRYPRVSGGSGNPSGDCSPSNNYGDIGQLVNYNPADNSCVPTNVPLDDYIWVLILAIAGFGFLLLNKQGVIIAKN